MKPFSGSLPMLTPSPPPTWASSGLELPELVKPEFSVGRNNLRGNPKSWFLKNKSQTTWDGSPMSFQKVKRGV